MTHVNPRCVAASVLLASLLAALLRGGVSVAAPATEIRPLALLGLGVALQQLEVRGALSHFFHAISQSLFSLQNDMQTRDLQQCIRATSLAELKLSDDPTTCAPVLPSPCLTLTAGCTRRLGRACMRCFIAPRSRRVSRALRLQVAARPPYDDAAPRLPAYARLQNAAVAGALLGARFGSSALPPAWLSAVARRAEVEMRVERYVEALAI